MSEKTEIERVCDALKAAFKSSDFKMDENALDKWRGEYERKNR